MEKKSFFAGMATRLFAAVGLIMVIGLFTASCSKEEANIAEELRSKKDPTPTPTPDPDPERTTKYDFKITCELQPSRFDHVGNSLIQIFKDAEIEQEFRSELKSVGVLSLSSDTIRVGEKDPDPYQTNISSDKNFEANKEKETYLVSLSDGEILKLAYEAQHEDVVYKTYEYQHGHDSVLNVRFLNAERIAPLTRGGSIPSQYLKDEFDTRYYVEVATQAYAGGKPVGGVDLDTLSVIAHKMVYAENGVEKTLGDHGSKVINETQQMDTVVIINTWKDGHVEKQVFRNIRERWLKNIAKREITVDTFDGQIAGSSFARVEGGEREVRQSTNWLNKGRETTLTKYAEVDGHAEEVTYTLYQESDVFTLGDLSVVFDYNNWEVENFADNFQIAISTKPGYDLLMYKNEIKTYYLDYIQMADEEIDWYKKGIEIIGHKAINKQRIDYKTYTWVSFEKIAIKSDLSEESMGTFEAEMPISVIPNSDWLINTDVYGSYNADELVGKQTAKSAKTAEKFFKYNQYTYVYTNNVSGQENKFTVKVPNDIVFDDGDVKCEFENSELRAERFDEKTVKASEDESKTTYKYNYTAVVKFGTSGKSYNEVDLPGTIVVAKAKIVPEVLKGIRTDYKDHTYVYIEKGYKDEKGNPVTTGTFEANIPISVIPQSNWVITTDVYGTYISDEFFGNQTGTSSETAEKFFHYNRYSYSYTNNVSGKTNKFAVSVPNDIIFDDGEVKYTFKNSDLTANKVADNISQVSSDDEKTVYAYTCTAGVSFGSASQDVVLPGTVNVLASNTHEHGKVQAVYFTSTLSENRSYWKNVCVIAFEDGYRSVGMADNSSNSFDFSMSSWNSSVNSAVYADGSWMPAQAADQSKCMKWWDENGTKREVLDYISTTAWGWNNGHNTVVDVRRSAGISASGYSVTLYLNGIAGQTLKF